MRKLAISSDVLIQALAQGAQHKHIIITKGVEPTWKLVGAHLESEWKPNPPILVLIFDDGGDSIIYPLTVELRVEACPAMEEK